MKIVDRQTFLAMPVGTVYAKYEPIRGYKDPQPVHPGRPMFGELSIKDETIASEDFYYEVLIGTIDARDEGHRIDQLLQAQEEGVSLPIHYGSVDRDACFDEDQLFAVWELSDVQHLIAQLHDTLPPEMQSILLPATTRKG